MDELEEELDEPEEELDEPEEELDELEEELDELEEEPDDELEVLDDELEVELEDVVESEPPPPQAASIANISVKSIGLRIFSLQHRDAAMLPP